jgi:hypothetical protein
MRIGLRETCGLTPTLAVVLPSGSIASALDPSPQTHNARLATDAETGFCPQRSL